MALNWSVKKCVNWQEIAGEDAPQSEANTTESVVFATMSIMMNTITEANWEEFYARLVMLEDVFGPQRYRYTEAEGKVDLFFKPEEIHRRIGLTTNANVQTKAGFEKHIIREMRDTADRRIREFKRNNPEAFAPKETPVLRDA